VESQNIRTYYKNPLFWFAGVVSIIFILLGGYYEPSDISRIMTTAVISSIPKENYITDKTYKVGTDIKAGQYVIISDGGSVLAKDPNDFPDYSEVNIKSVENRDIFEVKDGWILRIINGALFPISNPPAVVKVDGKIPAGTYKIGVDLPAGTYTIRSYDENKACVVATSIYFYTFIGEKSVEVKNNQYLSVENGYIVAK